MELKKPCGVSDMTTVTFDGQNYQKQGPLENERSFFQLKDHYNDNMLYLEGKVFILLSSNDTVL